MTYIILSANKIKKISCLTSRILGWSLLILISACSTSWNKQNRPDQSMASVPDPIIKSEPLSRYGNPSSYVINGKRYYTLASSEGYVQQGMASWYGEKFHGRRTSSGETYDMHAMTAAHPTLPLPTYAQVTNLRNNKKVIVRINDRGPFHSDRIIDLSYAAATKLEIIGPGTALVEVKTIAMTSQPHALTQKTMQNVYLQIGAFNDKSKAEQLQADLNKASRTTSRIVEKKTLQETIYLVHIGPFNNRDEAEKALSSIPIAGFGEPLFVKD